ncbi:MAG: hypothetical protein HGB17_16070 [Syntrophobacteraceae bacterium]|nr:hypothetical protein [Syntrophobacteraceae bacterium]
MGILLVASVPVIATHATMGYNNLQFSLYLVMGILWMLEGVQNRSAHPQLLGSLLLGLAVWTRPEGFAMAGAAGVGLWAADWATRHRGLRPAAAAFPALALAVPWTVFRILHPVGTVEAFRDIPLALEGLLGGDIRWGAMWTIVRYVGGQVLRYRDWGVTLLLVAMFLLWRLRPRHLRADVVKAGLFISSLAMGAVVFFAHYMAAYSSYGEGFVYDWLALEFTRVFMPVGIALTLLALVTASRQSEDADRQGEGGESRVAA